MHSLSYILLSSFVAVPEPVVGVYAGPVGHVVLPRPHLRTFRSCVIVPDPDRYTDPHLSMLKSGENRILMLHVQEVVAHFI